MPEYGHQTDVHRRAWLQGNAHHASKSVGRTPNEGEYVVVGRIVNGKRWWDVFLRKRDGGEYLIGRDFEYVMEAEEFIRDRRRGIITVGWSGGLRGRFQQAGRLLVPLRDIQAPAKDA